MESEKRRQHDESSRRYLEEVGHAYILDGASAVYKPKTATAKSDTENGSPGSHRKRPFWVSAIRDQPVFLVSIGTLILLIATVYYARKQWQEAQRTAKASEDAAHATAEASTMAKNSLELGRREFAASEAAVLQANVSLRNVGKGAFVQIDIINSGRIAATQVNGSIAVSDHQLLRLRNLIVTTHSASHSASADYASGFVTRTVTLKPPLDTHALAARHFRVSGELYYWNGLEKASSTFCYGLTVSPYTGETSWPDCENQAAFQQTLK